MGDGESGLQMSRVWSLWRPLGALASVPLKTSGAFQQSPLLAFSRLLLLAHGSYGPLTSGKRVPAPEARGAHSSWHEARPVARRWGSRLCQMLPEKQMPCQCKRLQEGGRPGHRPSQPWQHRWAAGELELPPRGRGQSATICAPVAE